jgi:hypothetical protein
MPCVDREMRLQKNREHYQKNKHLWKNADGSWKKGDPEKRRARMRRRYHSEPGYKAKHKATQLAILAAKRRFGICPICLTEPKDRGTIQRGQLVRDHCHATGVTRGWICLHCNLALGHASDSPERLRAMANYLEASRTTGETE